MQIIDLPIDAITVGSNRRPVKDISRIAQSILQIGLMNPIQVTPENKLIAGLHRLEAFRFLEKPTIPAVVCSCDEALARLGEIDENLIRNELTLLEQGEQLLERDQILDALGLRAKASPGTNQYSKVGVTVTPTKTTAEIAAEVGMSERSAQRRRQVARDLSSDVKEIIRDTPVAEGLSEMLKLSKQEPEMQLRAAQKIQAGEASNIHHALSKVKQEQREAQALVAAGIDAVEAPTPAETVKDGQWWLLGKHLLYCGDTSKPAFYQNIPTADLAFADPPYNAGVAEWDKRFEWRHDWLMQRAEIVAVTPGIASLVQFARMTKMPYRWTMSCWISNGMTRGELGFGNWIPVLLFAEASLHCNSQDVIKVTVNNAETPDSSHKGRKPSQLLLSLIETFTKPDELVIDPFLGSGTTLFAAEKSGRRCIGGEISPEYCAAIIARYETMTGTKAVEVDN